MSMPPATAAHGSLSFEIKSAELPLMALLLKSSDLKTVAQDFAHKYDDNPGFFDQDPLLIDLSQLPSDAPAPNFSVLLQLLKHYQLQAVAFKSHQAEHSAAALAAGLVQVHEEPHFIAPAAPAPSPQAEVVPTTAPTAPVATQALVIDRPLRSGQQVYARGTDLVVMAMVNPGAEVIADGNIHVYAPLRGKALAGARGNTQARIFTLGLEAELLSIAGVYRTSEVALPDNVRGKPAQVRLHSGPDGDKLLLEPLL